MDVWTKNVDPSFLPACLSVHFLLLLFVPLVNLHMILCLCQYKFREPRTRRSHFIEIHTLCRPPFWCLNQVCWWFLACFLCTCCYCCCRWWFLHSFVLSFLCTSCLFLRWFCTWFYLFAHSNFASPWRGEAILYSHCVNSHFGWRCMVVFVIKTSLAGFALVICTCCVLCGGTWFCLLNWGREAIWICPSCQLPSLIDVHCRVCDQEQPTSLDSLGNLHLL